MKEIRLDKFLVEMGIGTRSQMKELAKRGRITVDGMVEKKTDRKINPFQAKVCVDGQEIPYAAYEYYMLNKPQGVLSATEDCCHETVVDLIKDRKREDLFPVGRLDLDTEGLLLITNDGDLCHRLLSPKNHVDKVYFATVEGDLPKDAVVRFADGLLLSDGTQTMPSVLEILNQNKGCCDIHLTIREGKFHQVKRMFETLGCHVVYLKRLSMGSLSLDKSLMPGQYRPLTEAELQRLAEDGKEEKGSRC